MAEQLANLSKSEPKEIQTFEFNVLNMPVTTTWGSDYISATIPYDLVMDLTGKKIFVYFIPTTQYAAWIASSNITTGTSKINVIYMRSTAGTIDGKLYVMVTD